MWQDFLELVQEHPALTMLLSVVVVGILVVNLIAIDAIAGTVGTLHHNICTVVAESSRGNSAQYEFWTKAAARASLRAAHETGSLKAIDLDTVKNDQAIAAVYAPHPGITFPGC